jgi:hypothetical protein
MLCASRHSPLSNTRAVEVLPLIPDIGRAARTRRFFGLGEARGEACEGGKVTLLLLARPCGSLSADTTARIQALPLEQLEALAEAVLDFTGSADLDAWLAAHT